MLFLLCIGGIYCIYRYTKYENWQNKEIQRISAYVNELQNNLKNQNQQIEELTNELDEMQYPSVTWLEQGINYLAIGNSITSHPKADTIYPKGAIVMKEDEEGFEYPQINEEICARCGMCLKVCQIKAVNKHKR